MLEKLAQELHEARIKSGITLQQMAGKTRVDIKFLEAIDNGDFTFLADPYVKAFIKDYAKIVGLDENKILLKYEAAKKGELLEEIEAEKKSGVEGNREEQTPVQKYDATSTATQDTSKKTINPKVRLYGAIGIIFVFILLFIYLLFFKSSNEIVVPEKPIEEVVKSSKQRFVPEEKPKQEATNSTQKIDSLDLTILASDTSWVRIILDGKSQVEFILFPHSQKSIKTLDDYKITLGNAGAIKFQMNDKTLDFSGKPGAVRYVQINKNGITYLKSPPTLNSPVNE